MDQGTLGKIAAILNAGSTNYSVFLKLYEVQLGSQIDSTAIVQMVLGTGAVLGGIEEVQSGSVWPEVMEAVLYVGDSSAGPSSTALKSGQFTSLVELLKAQVDTMVKTSATIEIFWLSNGHPAYPVFWDFAFLFRTDATATIFIGASSD
ncbi:MULTISPECIES: hypothetical protein [unclassified Ensifer]|uniref:hypothetical protein n=1 Tax=unclassified Ensifer TaxID=2633371 RepID=UPI00070A6BE9|nr:MULTISPECIES: hypothetical protein [unclassified Ensifer]KQW58443.1 hypothetical protein ASD02_05370 [Ensifer sp. Root1252]KRC67279.1 hypothetical protein ASE32_08830 [Ensifer sp. Root231]KRC98356.1 hypothetical protein ASE47_04020 [Ensifer sp. Root258]